MSLSSRLLSVTMDLHNVLYLSYVVPASRVRPRVPARLPLTTMEDDRVFVSLVAMNCRNVRLTTLGWPRFRYDQLNLRTYVREPETGIPAVYFFRSGVSSRVIPAVTRLLGIPWERIVFSLQHEAPPGGLSEEYVAAGSWHGDFDIKLQRPAAPESTACLAATVDRITGPTVGFIGPERRLRRVSIQHRDLGVSALALSAIRFPLATEPGLLTGAELSAPHSVLLVPEATFTVHI
jgi:Uncharacterized conserved protein (COG2071)